MKKLQEKGPSLLARIKEKMPRVHVALNPLKKNWGKIAFVITPLAVAAVGAGVGIMLTRDKGGPKTNIEVVGDRVNRRIYLVSNDNLTIPLTVSLNKRDTVQEQMVEVFGLLKENSKAAQTSIKGVIPKDTKLNGLEVFEKELILDVSKEFLNYSTTDESKLLESVVYTYLEFPEVDMVSLYVDGERLSKLPKQDTVVPMCMREQIGINRESKKASEIAGKQMINVYYQKTIDSKNYLVPVSQYVDKGVSLETQLVNAIDSKLNEDRGLKELSDYSLVSQIQSDESNDKFVLNVKESALVEEGVVKRSLYDLVSLTMKDLVEAKEISFVIDAEEMMVEGLLNPDSYEVSNYIYNQVEI